MVLVQFRDHFITDTLFILLLKSGLRFALGPSERVFEDILFLGAFPIVIPTVIKSKILTMKEMSYYAEFFCG